MKKNRIRLCYAIFAVIMAVTVNPLGAKAAEKAAKAASTEASAAADTAQSTQENVSTESSRAANDYSNNKATGKSSNNEPLDNATVIVSKYSIKDTDAITPGKQFTLDFTVQNTSYTQRTGNIYVTCEQEDKLFFASYGGTNIVYVGYLKQRETRDCEITLVAADNIDVTEILASLDISFSDDFGTYNQNKEQIQLPITRDGVLDVTGYDVPTTATTDSKCRIGITYKNSGMTAVNNVVLHIQGDKIENQVQQLSSLSGGVTTTADCYVQFAKSGTQDVSMYFTYTDAENQTHQTNTQTYTFNVDTTPIDDSYTKELTGMEGFNKIFSAGVLGVCVIMLILVRIKRRKH